MIRISWPLGVLLAVSIAIAARRPRLVLPLLAVIGVWFVWQLARRPRR